MSIARALASAGIGRAEERQPQRRPAQQVAAQVLHSQVSELVADVEANALGMLVHRVNYVRHQHNELCAEELGGERIETAVAVQDIGLRARLHL